MELKFRNYPKITRRNKDQYFHTAGFANEVYITKVPIKKCSLTQVLSHPLLHETMNESVGKLLGETIFSKVAGIQPVDISKIEYVK